MDTYKLINSKAVQEYCKKIKHQFNILELAVLIYRNKRMSIDEKISVYKELIAGYPDMKMVKKYRPQNYDTVKAMIKGEIERIRNLVNILKTDEQDVIYTYNYYCKNIYDNGIIEGKDEYRDVYKTLKEVQELIEQDIKEDEENEILSFFIRKRTLREHKDNFEIKADYILDENRNLKLVNISNLERSNPDISMLRVNIPVPFKKGDLLIATSCTISYKSSFLNIMRFPFVLDNLTTWKENFQEFFLYKENFYFCDTESAGYLITKNEELCYDNILDYDSWEYFEGELKGSEKLLKGVSSLIKGQIGIELFLQGYEYIKAQNNISLDIYTKEGLELAGLSKKDIKTLEFRNKLK